MPTRVIHDDPGDDDDDEEVVFDLRPHVKRLFLPAVVGPVVVGAASYGYFTVPWHWLQLAIVAVAALVVLRYVLTPWLRWLTTHYTLTTHRLVVRQGVLRRSGRDIPLGRIADVAVKRSIRDRMLGCGTLVIETGGRDGQVVLADVPRVEKVLRELGAGRF